MKIKDDKTGRFIPQPLEERFWEKVEKKPNGCWLWKGYTNGYKSYGRLRHGEKNLVATHVSWYIHNGKWPKKFMCHHCDNKACVNPKHLFEGTHQDNMSDMVEKGRAARGELSGTAILTDKIVGEIKDMLNYNKPRQIAEKTGVNYWSIIKIKNNKQWSHVK